MKATRLPFMFAWIASRRSAGWMVSGTVLLAAEFPLTEALSAAWPDEHADKVNAAATVITAISFFIISPDLSLPYLINMTFGVLKVVALGGFFVSRVQPGVENHCSEQHCPSDHVFESRRKAVERQEVVHNADERCAGDNSED